VYSFSVEHQGQGARAVTICDAEVAGKGRFPLLPCPVRAWPPMATEVEELDAWFAPLCEPPIFQSRRRASLAKIRG